MEFMTFKIYVGGQRVESERVLGEAWRTTVRACGMEWNGMESCLKFEARAGEGARFVSYRLRTNERTNATNATNERTNA